jgi:demethylmenaquinone methyltransferase / 2-methoxy-6-polyprenyl-1,4-benzoquinol methylase
MPLHKGNLSAQRFFTDKNANSYDKLVCAATFGQDKVWKKQIVNMVKECNIILDLGCGTGILSAMIQQNNNFGIVYGLDLTFEYLKVALAKRMNIPLLNATAEALPFKNEAFDSVVASYIPKYTQIDQLIDECLRVLKKKGILILHDFTYPPSKVMRVIWKSYFAFLRQISDLVRSWKDVFVELDSLIETSKWVIECMNILSVKGVDSVECMHYTLGTAAIIVAYKL